MYPNYYSYNYNPYQVIVCFKDQMIEKNFNLNFDPLLKKII